MKKVISLRTSDNTFIISANQLALMISANAINVVGKIPKDKVEKELLSMEKGSYVKGYISRTSNITPTLKEGPTHQLYIIADNINIVRSKAGNLVAYVNIIGKVKVPTVQSILNDSFVDEIVKLAKHNNEHGIVLANNGVLFDNYTYVVQTNEGIESYTFINPNTKENNQVHIENLDKLAKKYKNTEEK